MNAPISLREALLPAQHLARFVVDIVAQLDLSKIYAGYAEQGGEATAPEALFVDILLLAKSHRASYRRLIELETQLKK